MPLLERITVEPGKCGGKPCVRGMRIRVSDVLGLLARGLSPEQVVEQLPDLEPDDVRASLEYAAQLMERPVAGDRMKLWLDAQLSFELAAPLGSRLGITVEAVKYVGLRDASDEELFAAARRIGGIAILSKDADFVDLVRRHGAPPQVIWLTCGNLSNLELIVLLTKRLPAALAALEQGAPLVEVSGDSA